MTFDWDLCGCVSRRKINEKAQLPTLNRRIEIVLHPNNYNKWNVLCEHFWCERLFQALKNRFLLSTLRSGSFLRVCIESTFV